MVIPVQWIAETVGAPENNANVLDTSVKILLNSWRCNQDFAMLTLFLRQAYKLVMNLVSLRKQKKYTERQISILLNKL